MLNLEQECQTPPGFLLTRLTLSPDFPLVLMETLSAWVGVMVQDRRANCLAAKIPDPDTGVSV